MGANAYVGSSSGKFTQVTGVRYKTSRSLLKTTDTDAEFNPNFIDAQTYITYKLAPKWEVNALGNIAMGDRGTYHLNFTLDPNKDNYIAIYDADGKNLIDEVTIPAGQTADVSYGRVEDGKGQWGILPKLTPAANNITNDSNEKVENFQIHDSWGIAITIVSMATVFLGLFLLYVIFKQIGKASIKASKRNAQKTAGKQVPDNAGEESGDIFAAIATALYELDDDNHDNEQTVLTIRKVTRNYSPWSSKIYGLREVPNKK